MIFRWSYLYLLIVITGYAYSIENNCDIFINKADVVNSEFYINFEKQISNILTSKGYIPRHHGNESNIMFTSFDYTTVGSNFLKLQQINFDLKIIRNNTLIHNFHSMKNCYTVSCTSRDYLKALSNAIKNLVKSLPTCSSS